MTAAYRGEGGGVGEGGGARGGAGVGAGMPASSLADLVARSDRLMLETVKLVAGKGPWTEEGGSDLELPLPE